MAGKPKALPDYFTAEEAKALVAAAPSYQVRMAMRVMLRTGLRVGECLSLRPEVTGNKSKKGREVPIPDDLVESLGTWRRSTRRTDPGRSSTSAGSGSARA